MRARITPQEAWMQMVSGNQRFIAGSQEHPHQDAARRDLIAGGQSPDVALFGCSDSRLAAEIIFDRGLGDLFVIRNIGHVVAESIVASLEFAVTELGVALVLVLAHDSCGAVKAAVNLCTDNPDEMPRAVVRTLQPIVPSVQWVWHRYNSETPYVAEDEIDADEAGRHHLRQTVQDILRASAILRDSVAAGKLGIVGCQYSLTDGHIKPIISVGPLETGEAVS
nr:carbonic anhydrase [Canibacter zhoujuaniae]